MFPSGGEAIVAKFEEEVDGKTLLSPTMQTAAACEKLAINTLGNQEKFFSKVKELNSRSSIIKNHLKIFVSSFQLFLMVANRVTSAI